MVILNHNNFPNENKFTLEFYKRILINEWNCSLLCFNIFRKVFSEFFNVMSHCYASRELFPIDA